MNTVKFLSVMEMVGFLKTNGTGCRFVSILTETEPKLKKSCPHSVTKIARRVGWLNINYNMAVRRRIAEVLGVEVKNVDYQNGPVWYQHVMTAEGKALPLCVNKKTPDSGKFYVQYFPHKSDVVYQIDGKVMDQVEAERLLEQYAYARPEREEFKPNVITIGLENVKELRASGLIIETPDTDKLEQLLAAD